MLDDPDVDIEELFGVKDFSGVLILPDDEKPRLVTMLEGDTEFVCQCLLICLDSPVEGQLAKAVQALETLLIDPFPEWSDIFSVLLERAAAVGDLERVEEVLALAHDSQPPKLMSPLGTGGRPPPNHPALKAACNSGKYEIVRQFVDRGYRLRLNFVTKGVSRQGKDKEDQKELSWRHLIHQMGGYSRYQEKKEDDDVNNLIILRLMVKTGKYLL